MAADVNRFAQVFLWKEGTPPDIQYAREVLRVINPDAYRAILGTKPPLHVFAISGPWPDDPWARALADMRATPAPGGVAWTDANSYDLAGWQGVDKRTNVRIFVVTAYRRVPTTSPDAITGTGLTAPRRPVAQTPYTPNYPTGPVEWPPVGQAYGPNRRITAVAGLPPGDDEPPADPLALIEQVRTSLADSYAPYYVSFGQRLVAGLIDFFFMSLFQVGAITGVVLQAQNGQPHDLEGWVSAYGLFACLALVTFAAYHVLQWTIWGQTPGKRLMGVRVVLADGSNPGFGRSVLRMVGYFFSFSLLGCGFLMIALDPRRQGLHDKIAETFVVPEKVKLPVPLGLPGYRGARPRAASANDEGAAIDLPLPARVSAAPAAKTNGSTPAPALGLATVATQSRPLRIAPQAIEMPTQALATGVLRTNPDLDSALLDTGSLERSTNTPPMATLVVPESAEESLSDLAQTLQTSPISEATLNAAAAVAEERATPADEARTLFKRGLSEMEQGTQESPRGFQVEPAAARGAALLFKQALDVVPASLTYRYFYAVALRYSEGFEVALREFRHVLELDPSHYEARQQVAYGARWHDAFAYPAWVSPAQVNVREQLPTGISALLPPGGEAVTRMVLLREGGNKVAAFLSRIPRKTWTKPPTPSMLARLHLIVSRTPFGPIIALYIVIEDDLANPYIGETFLNPHDSGLQSDDTCMLGQNLLAQLARQDRTYLAFVDEEQRLLLSRKLVFDAATQVSIARILYEVQTLPPQVMDQERFREAARWHMQDFSLDQVKA